MDKPLRFGHGHQSTHFGTTARLANDSDIVGVSAKLPDIVVYPFQAGDQVENAHIARCFESLTGHRKIGKPDRPQTMIDGYEHDVTITADIFAIITILFNTITVGKAASM